MRIIIDTELQAIIVPDSYYSQVDKLNEIVVGAGGRKLDYTAYIQTCFDKAYATQIICQGDLKRIKGANAKKRKPTAKPEDKSAQMAGNEKK